MGQLTQPSSYMNLDFGNNNQSLTGMNEYITPSFEGAGDTTGGSSYADLANFGKTKANPFGFMSAGNGSTAKTAKGFDSIGLFGAASQGLSALGSLVQAYNGYKQIQLGRDAFNFSKATYNQDTANQSRLVNSELEDRQKARISSTGNNNANGAYESLGSYMDKNRVSARPI